MINGSVTDYNHKKVYRSELLVSQGRREPKLEKTISDEHRIEGEVDINAAFKFLKTLLAPHGLDVKMSEQTLHTGIKLIDAESGEVVKIITSADIVKSMQSARTGIITDIEV
ncbi:hypothetical protein ACQKP8_23255 [Photobacterium alginatilyticum]|uniref:hypothetical protein n=1 Tax=Photobacterium alginatilyticum TaxID=1775171 RepID=UPI004067C82D